MFCNAEAFDAVPFRVAVMVPAAKFPFASLSTIVFGVLADVVSSFTIESTYSVLSFKLSMIYHTFPMTFRNCEYAVVPVVFVSSNTDMLCGVRDCTIGIFEKVKNVSDVADVV